MGAKNYIKRALKYIIKGIPIKNVWVNIVTLHPNELLKGRVALITGGTDGIGFAIAKAFLNSGATVIITGRKKERLKNAFNKLQNDLQDSKRIHYIVLDNTNVSSFEERFLYAQHLVEGHYIDILVNNAGVLGGDIKNTTEEEYDLVLNTNLKGTFFLSQMIGKYMKENKIEGNILNIASSSSLRPASSAYTLTKWGVRGLTLGLAKSFIPYGIVVNGVAPGPTATSMIMKDKSKGIGNDRVPMGRLTTAEEIANMTVFLTSGMGRSVVGDIVYMTGGAGTITLDDINYSF